MSNTDNQNPNRAPWTNSGQPADSFASDPYSPNNSSSPPPPAKSRLGCWFWGCLGTLVFGLIGIIGIGFGGYWFLTSQVTKYTDTQPAEIPVVEYDDEELKALEARIESFTNQVKGEDAESEGDASVPADGDDASPKLADASEDENADSLPEVAPIKELSLSADEINALIASQEQLRGRVFVRIEEGRVFGQVSIPTDMVPGGNGRFFNADGEFDVSMEDGILVVKLTDASVKGQQIPASVMEGFASENLAKDAYKDAKNAEMLRKFEKIEVVDDKIILKLRETEEQQ